MQLIPPSTCERRGFHGIEVWRLASRRGKAGESGQQSDAPRVAGRQFTDERLHVSQHPIFLLQCAMQTHAFDQNRQTLAHRTRFGQGLVERLYRQIIAAQQRLQACTTQDRGQVISTVISPDFGQGGNIGGLSGIITQGRMQPRARCVGRDHRIDLHILRWNLSCCLGRNHQPIGRGSRHEIAGSFPRASDLGALAGHQAGFRWEVGQQPFQHCRAIPRIAWLMPHDHARFALTGSGNDLDHDAVFAGTQPRYGTQAIDLHWALIRAARHHQLTSVDE